MITAPWTTTQPSNETRARPAFRPAVVNEVPQSLSYERPETLIPAMLPAATAVIELTALPKNWNSYGAPPVAPSAALHAVRLLARLGIADIQAPEVSPNARAGVQFSWGGDDRMVSIEVSPNGDMSIMIDINGDIDEEIVVSAYDPFLSRALALASNF